MKLLLGNSSDRACYRSDGNATNKRTEQPPAQIFHCQQPTKLFYDHYWCLRQEREILCIFVNKYICNTFWGLHQLKFYQLFKYLCKWNTFWFWTFGWTKKAIWRHHHKYIYFLNFQPDINHFVGVHVCFHQPLMGCLTSPFSLLISFITLCFFFSFSFSLSFTFFFSLSSWSLSFALSLVECSVEAEKERFQVLVVETPYCTLHLGHHP